MFREKRNCWVVFGKDLYFLNKSEISFFYDNNEDDDNVSSYVFVSGVIRVCVCLRVYCSFGEEVLLFIIFKDY